MATTTANDSPRRDSDKLEQGAVENENGGDLRNADGSSIKSGTDLLELQALDPALNMKMHLVNNVRPTGI